MVAGFAQSPLRDVKSLLPTLARRMRATRRHVFGSGGSRFFPLVLALALVAASALEPGRLYPFSSTAMWLYLPLTILVTLRWGAGVGILTSVVAAAIAPTVALQLQHSIVGSAASARVLLPLASAGMLGTVLGVADLNRRRLGGELRSRRNSHALLTVSERLNAAADPEDVLLHVVQTMAELLAAHAAVICTTEGDRLKARYSCTDGVWTRLRPPVDIRDSCLNDVVTLAVAYRGPASRKDCPFLLSPSAGPGVVQALAVPIPGHDRDVRGVLGLFDRSDGEPFSKDDERLAEAIAHHAAVALDRAQLMVDLHDSREALKTQASSDSLTGLSNRAFFLERLQQSLSGAQTRSRLGALLFLDLDEFKFVNDRFGHPAGDELLHAVAQRLQALVRESHDTIARLGGDEFAILLGDVKRAADAVLAADRILASLHEPFSVQGRQMNVTASIGIALHDSASEISRPEDLLREADIALYAAKAAGKAQALVFSPDMAAASLDRLDLLDDIRTAIEHDELRLYYQPIVDLRTSEVVAMEALLRWNHPRRGFLEPGAFLPLVEQTGLMVAIGRWVLRQACSEARTWPVTRGGPPLRVTVNISTRQLDRPNFVDEVLRVLEETGLEPRRLELELTESVLMEHAGEAESMLRSLKQTGISVAIDDFGTGYSSLGYLERLPVDRLKIDRSFLATAAPGTSSGAIVQAIVALARELHIGVVAEGVDTEDKVAFLRSLGCSYAQGYYFARPLPAKEALRALGATLPQAQLRVLSGPVELTEPQAS